MTRLFVGLDVPDYIKQEIDRIQKELLATHLFEGTMVQPQQLHLTLKYIGEVPDQQVAYIDHALKSVQFNKTVALLDRLDIFVDDGINVVYVAVDCPVLDILVDTFESVLESWCMYDNLPFVAHLTLFKVSQIHNKDQLINVVKQYKINQLSFEVNDFLLKKVTLDEKGSIYDTISRYEFR